MIFFYWPWLDFKILKLECGSIKSVKIYQRNKREISLPTGSRRRICISYNQKSRKIYIFNLLITLINNSGKEIGGNSQTGIKPPW